MAVTPERYACRGLGAGRNGSLSDATVREGTMAGDEVEVTARLRRRLEEEYGMREAAYLTDRPIGGWDSLATKEYVDARLDALRHELRGQMSDLRSELKDEIAGVRVGLEALSGSVDRRLRAQTWITTTVMITGLGLAFTVGRFG
jgi:hypothetical protein